MALTLAQAKVGMTNKFSASNIDDFMRESQLLAMLTFDDTISPGTGGSNLGYNYTMLATPSQAGTRALNSDYTGSAIGEAQTVLKTSKLSILGGKFSMDRVVLSTTPMNIAGNFDFQLAQKREAVINAFNNMLINGDTSSDANAFDGLTKLIAGMSTEVDFAGIDISTPSKVRDNWRDMIYGVDDWLTEFKRMPDILMGNRQMISKIGQVAKEAGYYERNKDDFGNDVSTYAGIKLMSIDNFYNGLNSQPIIHTDITTGQTSLYAISLGLDALHGISLQNSSPINIYAPDVSQTAEPVVVYALEMILGIVLKSTVACGIAKNIKITPPR